MHKLKLIRKEEICRDAYALYFNKKESTIKYLAGQFVTVAIPDFSAADGRGNERHFSIANSPAQSDFLEIIIRKSNSHFSNTILNLPIGSVLLFDEPRGEINSKKIFNNNINPVFIAGGTGITPVRSIIQDLEDKKIEKYVTLFYANRTLETAVFFDEFTKRAKEKNNFIFIPILEEESKTIKTERGFFSAEIFKKYIGEIDKHNYFVTGPPMMLSESIKVLVNSGVTDEKIFLENI